MLLGKESKLMENGKKGTHIEIGISTHTELYGHNYTFMTDKTSLFRQGL